jgi:hypothetical protein
VNAGGPEPDEGRLLLRIRLASIEKSIPAAYSDLLEYDITISFDQLTFAFALIQNWSSDGFQSINEGIECYPPIADSQAPRSFQRGCLLQESKRLSKIDQL